MSTTIQFNLNTNFHPCILLSQVNAEESGQMAPASRRGGENWREGGRGDDDGQQRYRCREGGEETGEPTAVCRHLAHDSRNDCDIWIIE